MSVYRRFFVSLVTAVFLILSGAATSLQAYAAEIACINMQKVLKTSQSGKKVREKLEKKFEKLRKQLQAKQEELQAFKKDLEKKAPLMNDEARAAKERQYKKMLREFKDQSDDAQFEMRQAEQQMMEPLIKELEKVVTQIGKEKGYALIIEKNMPGVYYTAPAIDITDMVIKRFDKAGK